MKWGKTTKKNLPKVCYYTGWRRVHGGLFLLTYACISSSCACISASLMFFTIFFFILSVDVCWYTCIVCTILFIFETIGFTPHTTAMRSTQVEIYTVLSEFTCVVCVQFCFVTCINGEKESVWRWVWVHTIRSVKLAITSVCALSTATFFFFKFSLSIFFWLYSF